MAAATKQAVKEKPADLESEVSGFETTIEQFRQLKLNREGSIHH
jgi:valyl-tRNA synthetase